MSALSASLVQQNATPWIANVQPISSIAQVSPSHCQHQLVSCPPWYLTAIKNSKSVASKSWPKHLSLSTKASSASPPPVESIFLMRISWGIKIENRQKHRKFIVRNMFKRILRQNSRFHRLDRLPSSKPRQSHLDRNLEQLQHGGEPYCTPCRSTSCRSSNTSVISSSQQIHRRKRKSTFFLHQTLLAPSWPWSLCWDGSHFDLHFSQNEETKVTNSLVLPTPRCPERTRFRHPPPCELPKSMIYRGQRSWITYKANTSLPWNTSPDLLFLVSCSITSVKSIVVVCLLLRLGVFFWLNPSQCFSSFLRIWPDPFPLWVVGRTSSLTKDECFTGWGLFGPFRGHGTLSMRGVFEDKPIGRAQPT